MQSGGRVQVKTAVICALTLLASGCASITGSEIQNVALRAKSTEGADVAKADCELKNDKGSWKSMTPGFVGVQRSAEDLLVTCTKEGHKEGMLRAVSRASGGMFGNIIFGGGIGAIIDHNKGTGYEYPNRAVIVMGETTMIDRRDEEAAEREKKK